MATISKKAALAIVKSITDRCDEQGLLGVKAARLLAISVASDVREIMLQEAQDKQWGD